MSSIQYHNDRLPSGPVQRRKSMRLPGYDYTTAGAYFITVCTYNREYLFGKYENSAIILNDAGKMISDVWYEIPNYYPGNNIDAFVVMPNHIHGIIFVGTGPCACPIEGRPQGVAPTGLPLPAIINRFKTMTTKRYADGVKQHEWVPFKGKLWQRSYFDRIIRNDREMDSVREYILNNPLNWETDEEYGGNEGK